MRIPKIVMRVRAKEADKLINLGKSVVEHMDGNSHFVFPVIPLSDISDAVSNVAIAKGKTGAKGNRGSHLDFVELWNHCISLHRLLLCEAQYVASQSAIIAANDYPLMAAIMTSSGFELKSGWHPQGQLGKVQNLHFIFSGVNRNQVRLKWAKPLEVTSRCNVKSYKIYRGDTLEFNRATQIETISKARFIYNNDSSTVETSVFWIVAVGAAGDGLRSDPITVTLLFL